MKAKTSLSILQKTMAVFAILISLRSIYATAQSQDKITSNDQQVIARLMCYEVKQEYKEQLQKALSAYGLHSLSSESNIMTEAYYERENPAVLWLIERWSSKNELDKFDNNSYSKAVRSLTALALSAPVKTIYIKDLEPISKQQIDKCKNESHIFSINKNLRKHIKETFIY